ncbi:MAG TPA: MmpS family transport accessory protein [Galbitalea sp.]|jgi:hypothetical protein
MIKPWRFLPILAVPLILAGCAGTSPVANKHVIEYTVTSNGTTGSVTYDELDNGKIKQQQDTAAKFPWTKTITITSAAFEPTDDVLLAQNTGTGTSIRCKIVIDGKTVANVASKGPYSTVTCTG